MAGNIKGITIEFNGDTTKLGNALRDINTKTKEVDKALRQVNTALKFNPGNTELLAQKQTLLKQKIEQTKEKLDALRQAQAKLDDDPAVDKTSQEYMELRREIIETESKLGHFEKELKKLDQIKFEQLGRKIKDIGGKMEAIGRGWSKYVTAPIVGGAAASVKAWKEVDDGLDIIATKTGATGKDLEGFKDIARDLAGEIPASFDEIGSAVGEVNTRFKVSGDQLKDLSGRFLQFSKLNDQDVSTAIDKTQKALKAWNLDAEDAGPLLDTFNKVAQDTGVSVDTLEDGLVKYAGTFQAMNLTVDEGAVMLGEFETSSIDSTKGMVGMQKALDKCNKEGKNFKDFLPQLQEKIKGATTDQEAMNIASEYFGTKVGKEMALAIRNGTMDLTAFSGAALDSRDSVKKAFEETMDPADKFFLALQNLKLIGYDLADVMFDMVAPALEKLVEVTKDLDEKWKKLDPDTQKLILKIAGIAAAIGPLLIVGGKLMTGIGGLVTNIPKVTGAIAKLTGGLGASKAAAAGSSGIFTKLFGVIKAHPIGLIVGALAVLTGAFLATGGDADAFAQKIRDMGGKVTEFVQEIAKKLPEKLPDILQAAGELFGAIIDALIDIAPDLMLALGDLLLTVVDWLMSEDTINTLIGAVTSIMNKCVEAIPIVIPLLLKTLGKLILSVIKHLPTYYLSMLNAAIALWSNILKGLEAIGKLILSALTALVKKVLGIIASWAKSITDAFAALLTEIKRNLNETKKQITDVWQNIKTAVTNKVKELKRSVEKYFSDHLANLSRTWDNIKSAAKEKWQGIKDSVVSKIRSLRDSLSSTWSTITSRAGKAWNNVKNAILKPLQTLKTKVKDIIDTIKGWFSNFSIRTPDIKLPHPTIYPPGWTLSDLLDGITPSIDIDWYKTGGIFDSPTIAGIGESGAEAVVPLDKFWSKMDDMADSIVNGLLIGLRTIQMQGAGPESVTIPIYLYPSGPKMGEETVRMYDTYKRRLG